VVTAVEWTPEQAALASRFAPPTGQTKYCPRCGTTKPLDEFPLSRRMYDGHHGYCKPCHAVRCAEYRNARGRALRRLQLAHRAEYDSLYAEELANRTGGAS
jgi:hypothetical protein